MSLPFSQQDTQAMDGFPLDEDSTKLWGRLLPLDGGSPIELDESKDEVVIGREGVAGVDVGVSGASISSKFLNGKLLGPGNKTILNHGVEITLVKSKGFLFHVLQGPTTTNPTQSQTEFELKYDLQGVVGRGNYSTVHLAINKLSGRKVAVKVIDKAKHMFNSKVMKALEREVEILKSVQTHPNVVEFEDAFEEGRYLHIVMEYLPEGDLLKLVEGNGILAEELSRDLFCQMVTVLKHLRSKGITHRDLKPDNWLVAEGPTLKLADFGIARAQGLSLRTQCGTPAYLAPEVMLGDSYDSRVDIYSIGVILFFLLSSGDTPYQEATTDSDLFKRIRNGDINWSAPCWTSVSTSAIDLIKQLMQVDPEKRIKLDDIENHEWCKKTYGKLIHHENRQELLLNDKVSKIGRSLSNTIVLQDPRISRTHCSISFAEVETDALPVLTVEGQNQVRVNMEPVKTSVELRDGDLIQLASTIPTIPESLIYLFKTPTPLSSPLLKRKLSSSSSRSTTEPPTAQPSKKSKLTPSNSTLSTSSSDPLTFSVSPKTSTFKVQTTTILPGQNAISIGRACDNSFILPHACVSSRHCRIFKRAGQVVLVDSSSNGTWVNEEKVGKGVERVVGDGDVVCVVEKVVEGEGRVEFVVNVDGGL
ncbi:Checkpoint kinase 2 [Podochytrium sp. JEL0797]|nr:Checkpoint kinase 2 [Podochytrium sp. JEL0797]